MQIHNLFQSRTNTEKHGIDFQDARTLWDDPYLLEISARSGDEPRFLSMKATSLDKKFDEGEDVTEYLDLSTARRPNKDQKRVNVDFPTWMVESLDREAARVGVTRQSIIKVWLAERLEKSSSE